MLATPAIMLSHKIQLQPTVKQEIYLSKACGIARFTWNWALNEWDSQYQAGLKPSGMFLKSKFNALKQEHFPWIYEVTKYACQQPFIHLQTAFRNFFSKRASYPKFKKKGIHDSFYVGNDQIKITDNYLKLPKLEYIKMRERLRFAGKIMSVTISRIADKWFAAIQVKLESVFTDICENQASVGIDLGIKSLAVLSNGEVVEGSKSLKKNLKKLKKLQRQMSRKKKGSKNRNKLRIKVARLHYRIACIRNDILHKLTTYLTRNFKHIGIEDLNVSGMMKNHNLARAILDMGFFEFKRQLEYKAILRGNKVTIADRWYPSSKTCSTCGYVNSKLTLADRMYKCPECGLFIDRDLNAAINLEKLTNH